MPPIEGIDLPGVLPFRGPSSTARRSSSRPRGGAGRVAVIGGGLLGLEAAYGVAVAGLPGHRRAPHGPADGAPARRDGRRAAAPGDGGARRRGRARAPDRGASSAPSGRPGCASPAARSSRPTWSWSASASGPRPRSPRDAGIEVEPRHRGRRPAAHQRPRQSGPSASAPSTAAWSTASSRRSTSRPASPPTSLLGARRGPTSGSLQWAKLKVMGVDLVSIGRPDGRQETVAADAGAPSYRKLVARGRPRRGRDPARRHARHRGPARGDPLRRGGRRPARAPRRRGAGDGGRPARRRADLQLQRRLQGRDRRRRARRRLRDAARGDGAHARRHRLRLLQGDGGRARRARDRRRGRRARLPVPVPQADARAGRRA